MMEQNGFDALKLENQMCFPLYAAAREVTKLYRPYLDVLNLTYTQYITMMVPTRARSRPCSRIWRARALCAASVRVRTRGC